jgi:hypothetical protein
MKQYEAVIRVMEDNGGFATLGFLYQEVLKVKGCTWRTQTPFASIRRIVQDERFFFKIRPGLWALKTYRNRLPHEILPAKKVPESKKAEMDHTYYQGLLVEVGNIKGFKTTVPSQDKNKNFLGRKLVEVANMKEFYSFSYDHLIRKARTIDVGWFNSRKMPEAFFEIEHSTNFQNSLLKFIELQDFNTKFFIVADMARKREYVSRISLNAFLPIKERVDFLSYDKLSDLHSKAFEYTNLERELNL